MTPTKIKDVILKVDAAALGACTKFSHRIQRAVGLTSYFIAKSESPFLRLLWSLI